MSVRIASLYAELGAKDTLTPALKGAKGELGTFKNSLGSAVSGLTGFSMAGLGAAAVAGGVATAIRKSVTDIIDYNKSILDASRATRMGVEDLSRFVQVGDDMGVGMESITRALQLATKNGFAPSIDSLAKLADRANAMASPTERAAMLAKIMGRNWAELDPILQLGGKRIRELAAAQKDGLVATEREIAETEKFRLAMDELNDAKQAFLNTSGLAVVTSINLENEAYALARAEVDKGTLAWWRISEAQQHFADALREGRELEDIVAIKDHLDDVEIAAGKLRLEADKGPIQFNVLMKLLNQLQAGMGGIGGTEGAGIGGADQRAAEEYERYRRGLEIQATSQGRDEQYYSRLGTEGAFYQGQKPSVEFTVGNTPNDQAWRAYWDMMAGGARAATSAVAGITTEADRTATAVSGITAETGRAATNAGNIAAQLESLHDKTITVTTINKVIDLQRDIAHQASGGPLDSGVTLVGEQGPELIVNGVVVPADETRKMLAMGLKPTDAFYRGSEENIAVGGNWLAPKPGWMASKDISLMPSYSKSVFSGAGVSSQDTPAQAAASAAVSAAAVSAAMAPQVAAAVGAAVPIAVGAMSAKQAEAIVASNDRLGDIFTRELRTLKHEMGRVVASAVQKVM